MVVTQKVNEDTMKKPVRPVRSHKKKRLATIPERHDAKVLSFSEFNFAQPKSIFCEKPYQLVETACSTFALGEIGSLVERPLMDGAVEKLVPASCRALCSSRQITQYYYHIQE